MRIVPGLVLLLALLAAPGRGQQVLEGNEDLDFDRTESWAMKYAASANLLTGLGVPRSLEHGSVELGFEGIWVPSLSEEERRVGFNGAKVEDINRTSVFPRPRVLIGLPRKFSVELSYVPPVEVFDLEPHLAAVAIGRPVHEGTRWRMGLRLFGQYGKLEADFTCPAAEVAAGDDRELNPFRCEEPSSDKVTIRTVGVELSAGFGAGGSGGSGKFEPYAAIGAGRMNLDFLVDARYAGIVDRTSLTTDGSTLYLTLGTEYRAAERWRWNAELFYSPLDVVRPPNDRTQNDELFNARASITYRLR